MTTDYQGSQSSGGVHKGITSISASGGNSRRGALLPNTVFQVVLLSALSFAGVACDKHIPSDRASAAEVRNPLAGSLSLHGVLLRAGIPEATFSESPPLAPPTHGGDS